MQYDKGNYKKMLEAFEVINWEAELSKHADNIEIQWKFFKEKYHSIEKDCVPRKNVFINGIKSKKLSTPLDSKNLKLIKKKNKIWGKIRKDLASAEQELQYNRLRNQIRRLTRKSKKLYEKNIARNAKDNPKVFWKYTQSKLKTQSNIPDIEMPSSGENSSTRFTSSNEEKASVFLSYFSSVFTEEPPGGNMPTFETKEFAEELNNIVITEDTILKKLKKLKTNKSPGPDKIHPRVLHELASGLATPLKIIFSTSIRLQELPQEWKHANVSAIHKKGSKTKAQNYRPVSLTCVLCKVLESIIRDEIIKHMKGNNLFSPKQFGFIAGRSTVLQLLNVLDIWTEILDQGGSLEVIYCDFMKAFDKVPHKRLIFKIEKYGITGNILGWVNSFLSCRTQCVSIQNTFSEIAPVTSGIPQGSVLGPLLFVIYINDLPEVVHKDSSVFLFADDTKVFRHIKSTEDEEILQNDIDNLLRWSNTWLLRFHPDKCVSMSFGSKPSKTYSMGNQKLNISRCEKDLGVHIDDQLKFDKHITNMVNKANKIMAITRKTFEYLDSEVFCYIYKGLVRPHLEYAAPIWSPHSIKMKEEIENVQRRATKTIPGYRELTYEERLKKLKLPTLAYRRTRGDMIQVYKILNSLYDDSIPNMLKLNNNRLRGHKHKLFIERPNRDIRKYTFSMRVGKIWNSLPPQVVEAETLIAFERELDKHWRDQELYFNFRAEINV